jgi:hypothetical protein
MLEPFSLSHARCAAADASLQEEISARTGSEKAASGIMRSIARFGIDPSIVRYEITPKSHRRAHRDATAVAWSVRAVRQDHT